MAKAELDIHIEQDGNLTIVRLDGPVDSATFESFKNELGPVFRKRGAHILLDCANLTYMNSKSIGLLAKYRRTCYVGGGRLALCGLNGKIVRTLDLLGLGAMLKTYRTEEEALAALQ